MRKQTSSLRPWTRRFVLIVLAAAGCMSIQSHMSQMCKYLQDTCQVVDAKEVEHSVGGGIGYVTGAITVVYYEGLKFTFTKLRPKNSTQKPPHFQPTIGVAVDPRYAGNVRIELASLTLKQDGATLPTSSDRAALALLQKKIVGAKWSVLRALTPLVSSHAGTDVVVAGAFRVAVLLKEGRKLAPRVPYLFAGRTNDKSAFTVVRLVLDADEGPLAQSIIPILDSSALDANDTIRVPAGQDHTLSKLHLFNNTKSSFSGTLELRVLRGGGATAVLYRKSIELASFRTLSLEQLPLAIAELPAGDYQVEADVQDAQSRSVASAQWPIQLESEQLPVGFEALSRQISVRSGGSARFWIRGERRDARSPYLMLMSATPGVGGSRLLGIQLPIVFDALSVAGLGLLGTAVWPDGVGVLDRTGFAKTTFVLPPGLVGLAGFRFFVAPVVLGSSPRSSGSPKEVVLVE